MNDDPFAFCESYAWVDRWAHAIKWFTIGVVVGVVAVWVL